MSEPRFNWEILTFNPKGYPYTFTFLLLALGPLPFLALFSLLNFKNKLGKIEFWFILLLSILPLFFYLLAEKGVIFANKIRFANTSPYVFFGILATIGIKEIEYQFKNKIILLIFPVLILINGFFGLLSYWQPYLYSPQFYTERFIPIKYLKATDFLNKNSRPLSHVLSTFNEGNFLPAFTLNKVYIGHEVGTENFAGKWGTVRSFYFGNLTKEEASHLIKETPA